jgi:hypothetical protein
MEQVYKSHHYGKSTVGEFLNPVNGVRGRMERQGVKPRDHARDNMIAIREKQRENRERQELEANTKPLNEWKMEKFKDVKSKISTTRTNDHHMRPESHNNGYENRSNNMHNNNNSNNPPSNFLRKGSLDGRLQQAREEKAKLSPRRNSPRKEPVKQPVPRVNEVAKLAPRKNTNFISANRDGAKKMSSPRKEKTDEGRRHSDFGHVPQYIQERKMEAAQQEERRRAALPDPDCPPGMKLMPESERIEMLTILKENEKDIHMQLSKLPLRPTTMSMIKRKEGLHEKLQEIENAQKMFSKPKVFIQL